MNDYNSIAIFVAARNGDLDSLSARLNKLNLQETLADKRTLLHLAASRGHAHIVHFLIRNDANIDAKDINEYTPLSLAIGGNYMEVAKIIIQNGADVNIRQRNGETPLHIASRLKNIQFVEILLKNGADVNISSKYGGTPLYIATVSENIQLVEILLKNGADINIVNRYGETPLHVATKVNNIQLVDILLKNGADVNILNNYEKTPLHIATEMENIQLVDILLKNSADVNIVNADGKTPLHVATKMKNIQLLDILLKNGADVNIVSKYRETPLHVATKVNNIQFVEILLQNGAKLNGQDNFRKTIRRAVENNHIELIKILFKHGAKVYQLDKAYEGRTDKESSMTALHIAVKYRNFEMVKLLMTNGFDRIDAINELGETPLDLSIQSNCLDVVKHLIENGAKIRRKPVLEEALRSGNLELWKYLLTCNSTIIAKTCPCDSELHSAVRASQVEIVEEIIKKEAIKVKSDLRSCGCAVYIAVENGNEEILKILLTAGFSIKNFLGINPLHVAATFEHTRLVELLLKFGANINSRTDEHMITPLDFAAAAAHANMVKFLLDVGANPMVNRISDLTSLHYTLHRLLDNANETCVTPLMFQNLLKITEMLLIAGVNKIDEDNYEKLIINAIKLTVSSDDEQNSSCFNSKEISTEGNINDKKNNAKGEFRPEIIRCLLNYLKENKVNEIYLF
ncbi:ankyrin-1-like isoform X2 [Leptopilina boulardi]|uniref:ankyrin-1-like isoform X2 n=1 Tax=Leptopilina boulardi TaxID=63433 RepID=UPI0021F603A2|nr:ankyrin-1-like isoform X2 [Leptopilina boulardi]